MTAENLNEQRDPCIDVTEKPCLCKLCDQLMEPCGRLLGSNEEAMECICAGCGASCMAELLFESRFRTWEASRV